MRSSAWSTSPNGPASASMAARSIWPPLTASVSGWISSSAAATAASSSAPGGAQVEAGRPVLRDDGTNDAPTVHGLPSCSSARRSAVAAP